MDRRLNVDLPRRRWGTALAASGQFCPHVPESTGDRRGGFGSTVRRAPRCGGVPAKAGVRAPSGLDGWLERFTVRTPEHEQVTAGFDPARQPRATSRESRRSASRRTAESPLRRGLSSASRFGCWVRAISLPGVSKPAAVLPTPSAGRARAGCRCRADHRARGATAGQPPMSGGP